MSQNECILQHLKIHGNITSLEAMQKYGIMRLASRIHDLRSAGYDIKGETVAAKNRYGQTRRFARYRLNGGS